METSRISRKNMTKPRSVTTKRRAGAPAKRRASPRSDHRATAPPNATSMPKSGAKRRLPLVDQPSSREVVDDSESTADVFGDGALRFHLERILRLSDLLMSKAVAVYDRLFMLGDDDQADIYLGLGREFAKTGKPDEALVAFRKAAKLKPEASQPRLELAALYLRRKSPQAAIKSLTRATELGATGARVHLLSAEALTQQGDEPGALRELQRAARLKPKSAELNYRVAVALDRSGDFDGAAKRFRKAIALRPTELAYHQALGFSLESAGQRADALDCFKRALELERRDQDDVEEAAQ